MAPATLRPRKVRIMKIFLLLVSFGRPPFRCLLSFLNMLSVGMFLWKPSVMVELEWPLTSEVSVLVTGLATSQASRARMISEKSAALMFLSVGCPATMADTHPSTSQCTIGHHLPPWPRPWPLTPCSLAKQLFALFTCQSGLSFTNFKSSLSLLLFTLCNFNYRSIVSASQVPIFRVTVSIFLAGPIKLTVHSPPHCLHLYLALQACRRRTSHHQLCCHH